jgi:FkbM family methyltransferase
MDVSYPAMRRMRPDYDSQFEICVAAALTTSIRPGDVAIDGGANGGLHTLSLARAVGSSGHVVAYEPIPSVWRQLVLNTSSYPWVTCRNVALLDRQERQMPFFVDSENPALSRLTVALDITDSLSQIQVPCVTMDEDIVNRPIAAIKLDLEGAEFSALRGAAEILRSDRPLVVFENGRGWNATQHSYTAEDFFDFFEESEYELIDLHGAPLTRESWNSDHLGFEFIATSTPQLKVKMQQFCIGFWSTIADRPILTEWSQCLDAVNDVAGYLDAYT